MKRILLATLVAFSITSAHALKDEDFDNLNIVFSNAAKHYAMMRSTADSCQLYDGDWRYFRTKIITTFLDVFPKYDIPFVENQLDRQYHLEKRAAGDFCGESSVKLNESLVNRMDYWVDRIREELVEIKKKR